MLNQNMKLHLFIILLASFPAPLHAQVTSGSLNVPRVGHTATLLTDGRVLVAGGNVDSSSGSITNTTEVYDPETELWALTGSLNNQRERHTATRLLDGRVLVVGGTQYVPSSPPSLATAELYDPATGQWTLTGSLSAARERHTATLLPDGRVLVAGGRRYDPFNILSTVELYDPATGQWTVAAEGLSEAQFDHSATLLLDGRVLVLPGRTHGGGLAASADIYDPATGQWSATPRGTVGPDSILLLDGRVLATDGITAELYDPATSRWETTGSLNDGAAFPSLTLMPDGRLLGVPTAGRMAELYDPVTGTWTQAEGLVGTRFNFTATLLQSGKVLIAGGEQYSPDIYSPSAEIYDLSIDYFFPGLSASDIMDDMNGGPTVVSTIVTYTVTFSEAMNVSTVTSSDFGNAGTASVTINSVTDTGDATSFEVSVTPDGPGTLRLEVVTGSDLEDAAGNPLDTSGDIVDDTIIRVYAAPPSYMDVLILDKTTTWSKNSSPGTFHADGCDKLVVLVTGEHNFPGDLSGNVTSVTYNGQPLLKAVDIEPSDPVGGGHGQTTSDIWYLDDPELYDGAGMIEVAFNGNNWVATAIGLSGTADGVGATVAVSGSSSVDLSTTGLNSLVIASVGMGGQGNTANVDAVDPNSPLDEASAIQIGSNWAGHVTGAATVAAQGLREYSFGTGNLDVVTIAAEFRADPNIVVANTNDSGAGSLRQAIVDVVDGGTITFDPSLSGATIKPTSYGLTLTDYGPENVRNYTIDASMLSGGITIDGSEIVGSDAMFYCDNHDSNITINSLAIVKGETDFYAAGAIRNSGKLTLNHCRVSECRGREAGAISNEGELILNHCTISGNHGRSGGAIAGGRTSRTVLNDSTASGNSAEGWGGGIFVDSGSAEAELVLNKSTVSGNTAQYGGGGIYFFGGHVELNHSTLSTNHAAGIGASGNINGGGGIALGSVASLTLNHSTVSGNSAQNGNGGGIRDYNSSHVAPLILNCSIVAGNSSGLSGSDIYRSISGVPGDRVTSSNLISDLTGSGLTGAEPGLLVADPLLRPLGDYGGPTETMPPLPGSPAIDAAGTSDPGGTDQRGFPRFVNGALDIGAVEAAPAIIVDTVVDENDGPGVGSGTSLRDAISSASEPGTMIVFDPAVFDGEPADTITLTLGQLTISGKSLEILGRPDAMVTIRGGGSSRVLETWGGAEVVLRHLVFRDGIAAYGGAVRPTGGGSMRVEQCVFTNNVGTIAGGAIQNFGSVLDVRDSTFTGNTSNLGAAVAAGADAVIAGCTIDANTGTGIYTQQSTPPIRIESCTITNNSGRGLASSAAGAYEVLASIVAGNGGGTTDVSPETVSLGGNLIGSNNGATAEFPSGSPNGNGDYVGTSGSPINPLLAPLGDYGGPTRTMPPLPGSPAIDAGSTTDPGGTDQRGFPRFVNGALDIGAVETGTAIEGFLVDTSADENDGIGAGGISLRDAIGFLPAGSSIHFDSSLDGQTITLASAQILIDKDLTITGSGLTNGITLDGGGIDRIVQVNEDHTVVLEDLTFANGSSSSSGGAILKLANANLTINRCSFVGNSAQRDGGGGAILSDPGGSLTVNQCTFFNNTSDPVWGGSGGAIHNRAGGILNLNESTVVSNTASSGGGIANFGTMTMNNSIVGGNSVALSGPDILASPGTVTLVGGNLLSSLSNSGLTGSESGLLVAAPFLAPLGDYGGPTPTMPPLPGSPVIDAAIGSTEPTDQRGFDRPNGPAADIGAVEAYALPLDNLTSNDGDTIPDILEGPDGPYPHLDPLVDDSTVDTDGDGSTDAEEIANMTNLFDAQDSFRTTGFGKVAGFDPANPVFEITFRTFPGLNYVIEAAEGLNGFAPVPESGFTADAYSETIQVEVPAGTPGFFFRAARQTASD